MTGEGVIPFFLFGICFNSGADVEIGNCKYMFNQQTRYRMSFER